MSATQGIRISLKIILIINESPWGSTLASTALRLARGMVGAGHELQAVFFREDGVYNSMRGTARESGVENPADAWSELNVQYGANLMVCQSSALRRLANETAGPFREAGLVELTDLIADCDRVITF